MSRFDVFNGDADGICALHQLRLAEPAESELVTGAKRDSRLLARVAAQQGDEVTVLDIGLDRNRDALLELLQRGARVRYVDHHYAGEIPDHPLLDAHIDTAPEVCTSVIVDRLLGGLYRPWAVVAAFGDNLVATARRLAAAIAPHQGVVAQWQELGECLNYNAYGETEADLIYAPAALYRMLSSYPEPGRFITAEPAFERLRQARNEDMARAMALAPDLATPGLTLHRLPDAPWARRVIGSFANHLACAAPRRAHAVLVPKRRGGLMLSLRVAPDAALGADVFCRRYGGGGRCVAAGVDDLSAASADALAEALLAQYGGS